MEESKGTRQSQGSAGQERPDARCGLHIAANGLRRWEPHAAGTSTRGIVGPQQCWLQWDQLLEARRAITHAVGEPPESVDGIVQTLVKAQAARGFGANGSLHGAEKALCTQKRNRHGAQLTQELVQRVQ